ncbi:C-glycoside deglycosidase beta subunit domain-containing protein [Deinococcus sonorensis]|uniref:C-deglycosylation enzyme beta subunit n=2 Tax=Deinococcus sonorensis TaxID=309891 RepID=A0AAU7U5Z3_9DEIO
MFDRYIVVEDTLKNVPDGVQFGARLPYYRGLGLSMIEAVDVTLDGQSVPPEDVSVTLSGQTYRVPDMEHEPDAVWNFGEVGTVTVRRPAGLPPGEHEVSVRFRLRVSYLPMLLTGQDRKVLRVGT